MGGTGRRQVRDLRDTVGASILMGVNLGSEVQSRGIDRVCSLGRGGRWVSHDRVHWNDNIQGPVSTLVAPWMFEPQLVFTNSPRVSETSCLFRGPSSTCKCVLRLFTVLSRSILLVSLLVGSVTGCVWGTRCRCRDRVPSRNGGWVTREPKYRGKSVNILNVLPSCTHGRSFYKDPNYSLIYVTSLVTCWVSFTIDVSSDSGSNYKNDYI